MSVKISWSFKEDRNFQERIDILEYRIRKYHLFEKKKKYLCRGGVGIFYYIYVMLTLSMSADTPFLPLDIFPSSLFFLALRHDLPVYPDIPKYHPLRTWKDSVLCSIIVVYSISIKLFSAFCLRSVCSSRREKVKYRGI